MAQLRRVRSLIFAVGSMMFVVLFCVSLPARAQSDPQSVVTQVIQQLQTGTPNPQWYGAAVWQAVALQTGNTGLYVPLLQLGPVTSTTVTQRIPLPTGMLYAITVQHQSGMSSWVIGISTVTRRIEYLHFDLGGAPQNLPSNTPSAVPSQPNPPSNPAPPQPSPACQKFPNLC